jgi:hypothetical protein
MFFTFILFGVFLLFELQDSSSKPTINKIIAPPNINTQNPKKIIKNNFSIDSNQTSILSSYICDKHGPPNNHFSVLYSYCFKVPIPVNEWRRAENYIESDIGFLIYTASIFYHTRATAMRDTWLSRVTHKYFLSATPYSWLPVTVIKGAGEDKISNMKKIFYGLQIVYNQQKNSSNPHKWYYLAGCDTFVNVPHVLKRLDSYDYTKPFLVGGHTGLAACPDSNGGKYQIEFPSGGAGFFISSKLLELIIPYLTDYVENIWPNRMRECDVCSDVALTCLIHKLGIRLTKIPGFWAHNPDNTIRFDGRAKLHMDPEPNNFHYVSNDEMYDLDEFYSFLHIDRLSNDKNLMELTEYIRTFASSHYELLRIKRRECTLPKVDNIPSSKNSISKVKVLK